MNQVTIRSFHRWLAPTLRHLKKKKDRLPQRPPDPRKSYVEWNYEAELYAFGKRLGETFDRGLLKAALTEKSYLDLEEKKQIEVGMEPAIQLKHNEELVEKGHNFIEQYILTFLTTALPKLPSFYIYKIKSYLMSEDILAMVSKNIGINDVILVAEDIPNSVSLCRGLKAIVQAVDDNARAGLIVRDLVVSQLCGFDLTKLITPDIPLKELEETMVKCNRAPPEYRLISNSGVNTLLPVYHVGVYCDKDFLGRGFGESVTIAKEMAACDVLWRAWGVTRRKPFNLNLEGHVLRITSSPSSKAQIDVTSQAQH